MPRGFVDVALSAAIALAALGPTVARAEDGPVCTWSLGAAGNLTPAGRGWDLSTPGPVAWSISPALSQQCTRHEDDQPLRGWAGVDLLPTLRHSYRQLGVRAPVLVLFQAGLDLRLGRHSPHFAGLYVATNNSTLGVGARVALWQRGPRRRLGLHGLELRAGWLGGVNPDFYAVALVRTHVRLVGEPALDDFGEPEHAVAVQTGFEVGPVTGWRLQLRTGRGLAPELGVRAGVFTNLFARTALQPIGLGYLDIPLGDEIDVEISGGTTLRDATWRPIGGLAFQLDGTPVVNMQLGALAGWDGERVFGSLDAGMSWVW